MIGQIDAHGTLMRNQIFLAGFALILAACVSVALPQYEMARVQPGTQATLKGYVSTRQEQLGLYPRSDWALRSGEVCFFLASDNARELGISHGDFVEVSAKIVRTQCGEKNIVCLQRCNKYALHDISVI